MGAKYLCCLPLRLGVLVISFLQFITSAAVTGLLAYVLVLDAEDKASIQIPSRTRIIMIVLSGVYGLVAVISLTGFIGAIRKKESYVGIFLRLIQGFLAVQILLTLANVILYFVDKNEFNKLCIGSSTDQRVIDACNSSSNLALWTVIVSAVVPIIFSAYGVYIVSAYAQKLRSRDAFVFNPGYARVGDQDSYPLTHPPAYGNDPFAHKAV
ncbi:hypothetical protein DFH08DRAFT_958068 [Mycena albidolilacea]|uniref:Tetraspanin n=1 Tax=Mycena albidolilacea TaxID=1033008 RepID=A0AAD7A624_9AGAR|nr:hypothetical protein DFH08DRAFT_958068 [Mycena albidolilacea]